MLKKEPMGAYEIQQLVEYRSLSKWIKVSTPSIYKKALQLEEKGFIRGTTLREGKMPEKVVYSLTEAGEAEFVRLMQETAARPIHFFLDCNAVVVNLEHLPLAAQADCLDKIGRSLQALKHSLEENLAAKQDLPDVPQNGLAVLRQQLLLAQAMEQWLAALRETLPGEAASK